MVYTHVLNRGAKAIRSPADRFLTFWNESIQAFSAHIPEGDMQTSLTFLYPIKFYLMRYR